MWFCWVLRITYLLILINTYFNVYYSSPQVNQGCGQNNKTPCNITIILFVVEAERTWRHLRLKFVILLTKFNVFSKCCNNCCSWLTQVLAHNMSSWFLTPAALHIFAVLQMQLKNTSLFSKGIIMTSATSYVINTIQWLQQHHDSNQTL